MDGAIVVDKPSEWTSHDVVARMRRIAGTKKIGHLGTLDPMATGVLPLVIGRATRLAQFFVAADKTYEGVIRFGYSTDTYDRDGQPTSPQTDPELDPDELNRLLGQFRGILSQTPPPISAKKINGTPAYKLARRKQTVGLKPVEVHVYSLELLSHSGPEARVRVHCSAGTYVRSIAHDAGQMMGCGAFLCELRRTAAGDFALDQACTLEGLAVLAEQQRLDEAVIPAARLLPQFPNEPVDLITAGQIRQGRDFRVSPFRVQTGARYVKAISGSGELVAIGEARLPNLYHPILVF
ncbi:MAG: tRNA pseudouridine(55) synthase TruB [Bryobacterales bacterium]|nr:tRNA pseudouridine(55) synthase TruB [Bryobacterales bacterium]